jgi:hypothetical protein
MQERLAIARTMSPEKDMRFWLEQAEADRDTSEAAMEFDPRTDRLPFNESADEAPAGTAELSNDARIRHLQRVPLFSGP